MNISKAYWYYCSKLGCRLYYIASPRYQKRPVINVEIWCPAVDSHVKIVLVGVGQDGAKEFNWMPTFPVDLYHRPYKLDPYVSKTCNQNMIDEWECLIASKKRELQ
jgi:hypothetical protein